MENFKTSLAVCCTGHRPIYFKDKSKEWEQNIKDNLTKWLVLNNPSVIISGLCTGWDTWVAEAAIECNIPVEAYIPFEGQGRGWPEEDKKRRQNILDKSQKSVTICNTYSRSSFLQRDRAMVDASEYVIALWNPSVQKGGSYYTVKYAQTKGKNFTNFWK